MLTVETDEVRAAAALWGRLDKPTRDGIRKASTAWAPALQRAVLRRAVTPIPKAVAMSGKVSVNNKGLVARFGSTGTFKGTPLARLARPWEFGGGHGKYTEYVTRSRAGNGYRIRRRAAEQVPDRYPKGRFIYPAVADATPSLVSMWVRAIALAASDG
jgi:hypothetical protein